MSQFNAYKNKSVDADLHPKIPVSIKFPHRKRKKKLILFLKQFARNKGPKRRKAQPKKVHRIGK